jgi:xanthine dehydrogenase accessory factor
MADNAFLDLDHVRRTGRRGLLVTVVHSEGSAYRRTGASAVVLETGEMIGAVSGGCLQADIVEAAGRVFATGTAELLTYNTSGADDLLFGTGSGCGGTVQLLVAPVADTLLAEIVRRLDAFEQVVLETAIAPGPDLGRRGIGTSPADTAAVFRQAIAPPTPLLLCGAGDDARPLAQLAAAAGFRVTVVDHRPAWATPQRFGTAHRLLVCNDGPLPDLPPGAYALLLTHHWERDLAHLKALLERPVAYVGMLGSADRCRRLVTCLLAERPDLAEAVRTSLRAPVGLDIGSDGPQEIAVAIVAELLAHRAGRPGTPLTLTYTEVGHG